MARNKKFTSHHKQERRLKEIQKASRSVKNIVRSTLDSTAQLFTKSKKENMPELPLKDIKRDLIKNVAFAVFTLVLLLVLKSRFN